MRDPVQEAIAELVFADQLVDTHELAAIEADPWLAAYLVNRQLHLSDFATRLMTAHDDPDVDEQALTQLTLLDQEALLNLLADLTAIDDHHDPREVSVLTRFNTLLRCENKSIEQRLKEAHQRCGALRQQLNQQLPPLRKRVRALRRVDQLFGQQQVNRLAQSIGQKMRLLRWRRETLFNHKAYGNSLKEMQILTEELMPLTQRVLQQATNTLTDLQQGFQHITTGLVAGELPQKSQEQIDSLLANVREGLNQLIEEDLDALNTDLLAKQRSLNNFCIAAVGRTRAGKSTLIAALTGRDQAAKGDGGQGFTRYNRAYRYRGIRLIDTPGVGAAGGEGETPEEAEQRDSEIARSIFPETDLVCLVMDSDSTTPCTRALIKQLHARGKAFIIALNVKAATRGGIDLCRQRLDAKFAKEGEQSINGNICSIRRDLSKTLGVTLAEAVPIIPIHAISAFNARYKVQDPEEREAWHELSRIDEFLEQLDQLITDQAVTFRRRTLRDNPQIALEAVTTEVEKIAQTLQTQASIFASTEENAIKQIDEIFADLKRSMTSRIDELFQRLEGEATTFSNDHYRKSGSEIEKRWRNVLEKFNLKQRIEDELEWLKIELEDRLEELQNDIHSRLQFQTIAIKSSQQINFGFDINLEETVRRNINLGFKVLGGVLGIAAMVGLGPAGWIAAAVVGYIPNLLDWVLPNAADRRKQAKKNLKQKLLETFTEPRTQISSQFEASLKNAQDQISSALKQSLEGSRLGLEGFHTKLLKAKENLQQQALHLS